MGFSIQQHLYNKARNQEFLQTTLDVTQLEGQITLALQPQHDDEIEASQKELSSLFYGAKENPNLLTDFAWFITRDIASFFDMRPLLSRLQAGEDISLSLSGYNRSILKWLEVNDDLREYTWLKRSDGSIRIWHRTKRMNRPMIAVA